MFTRRAAGFMHASVLCLAIWAGSAFADQNRGLQSAVGVELAQAISAGVPLEGMTALLDGSTVWPGQLFLRWKGPDGSFDGHVEWTSLNHVNHVEGTITETGDFVEVDFRESKALVKGNASVGASYHAIATLKDGKLALLGRWSDSGRRGPFAMAAAPQRAGQQSSLLQGQTVDDLLAAQAAGQEKAKPKIVWQEDALDWKIDGFEYPGGQRFAKLTCGWARDRLANGPSPGEMTVVITTADDSPLLGFQYRNHTEWTKHAPQLTHIDIYFSQTVSYHLPVKPQSNGWVYSTDPAMVRRIVASAKNDAVIGVSDMVVETGIPGLTRNSRLDANISTKGLAAAWTAAGYFMRNEAVPSMLEILERD